VISMSDLALRMEQVYKKFRRGETFNSLRDLIPALTGKMFQQQELSNKDAHEFWALQDISFEVNRGEAFGIIGHNGAGKSTILKILCKIMKPTRGRMVVHGRMSALIEVAAGFHQDLTGRENIFMNGTILGMSKREIASKFDQIVAFSGLEDFIDTPVKRYSSGMYARLGFSVAAHVDPEVMIVDEVLSVGDYVFQNKCLERMKEIVRNGTAVLYVSHNLKSVAEFCSRCILLEKGRITANGPAEQVVSKYLNRPRTRRITNSGAEVVAISKVVVRGEHGECSRFQSGQKVWLDVELYAHKRCSNLSLSLYITNDQQESIFDTSTERLGHGNFTLEHGDSYKCTFELTLNMANGVFHPAVLVYRYDTQTAYDRWAPAGTIYVSSEQDVRGTVHCFPKVIHQEIRTGSDATVAPMSGDATG
jgi:lipopolysaccharide transport system ATP-binding protein